MKVLFWNTNKKGSSLPISELIIERGIDIAVFAELRGNFDSLILGCGLSKYPSIGCDKLTVLGNYSDVIMGPQNDRYSFQIINGRFIICALHLPSRMYDGHQNRRNIVISSILQDLKLLESDYHTKNSIIVGDFNEDPYDEGCLSANYFFGLPYRGQKSYGVFEGKRFDKFYNPMWNLFGDFKTPFGTYFYNESNPKGAYWHIFDQVLIRPDLKDQFIENSLEIVTEVCGYSLLDKNGKPSKLYSDHLPIIFEIRED